ncbi:MAG: hypothetical protein C4518_18930 [Desulfobacteraceae bacterium]|nr:MAG: hypothetical protein C4518_18930 [Desulfobacteraceae bacterium]
MIIKKIISGGQTGADRAALDFAINNGIPHGGWVPKGRLAEDGVIPARYNVREAPSAQYGRRTELNVADAEGTLIISHGDLAGGSALTKKLAEKHGKPCLHIDLNHTPEFQATLDIAHWIKGNRIGVLNVAGSRASSDPRIYGATLNILETVFYLSIIDDRMPEQISRFYSPMDAEAQAAFPKTVDQAVTRLVAELPLKDKIRLSGMSEAELDRLNPSLAQYILTSYHLSSDNMPLLASCRETAGDGMLDADAACRVIIRQLWDRLRQTHRLRRVK